MEGFHNSSDDIAQPHSISVDCYMAASVFAMRLVNLRSVTCYTDQNFKENAHFKALNLFTSEKRFK